MKRWVLYFALAASPVLVLPLSDWLMVSSYRTAVEAAHLCLFLVPVMGAFLLFLVEQRRVLLLVGLCLVLAASAFAGLRIGHSVRMAAFRDLAERSRPLVEAIKAYERDQGEPPSELRDLVPRYLVAVPSTRMAASPDYEYSVFEVTHPDAPGNGWGLHVSPPSLPVIDFDLFFYLPSENYDEWAGGVGDELEVIGDWAYWDD